MGNAASQDTNTPPRRESGDDKKLQDTQDKNTQTEETAEGNLQETSQLPEYADNRDHDTSSATSRPEDPPPYSSADDDSDNTGVKKDLSVETEKEQLNMVTLEDLKQTLEKNSDEMKEKLESLQKNLDVNEERTRTSNQVLRQLQDTVYACFETKFDASNIVSSTDVSSGHDRFTERISKSVVEHLLNNEQLRDLVLQRDTPGVGNAASPSSEDLAATRDLSKKLEYDKESYSSDDDCCKCKCKKCDCNCHFVNLREQKESLVKDSSVAITTKENKQFVTKTSGGNDPGDEDPNSDSDDSDNDKKGSARDDYPKIQKNNKIDMDAKESNMRIDSDAWAHCFRQNDFEHEARKLLYEGLLPDKHLLKQVCVKYNRRSNVVQNICRSICRFLKQKSSQICDVWAAYRYKKINVCDDSDIVFVIVTSEPIEFKTDFQIYQRCIHKISAENEKENYEIKVKESQSTLESTEMIDLTICLKSNAKQFMEKHTKLTRVTLSWVKSRGFGSKDCSMQTSPCIALYVQIKDLVPINEEPFDEFVDGYFVDVREGVFTLCGSPTDLHQNVKMGCALDSGFGTKQGTVGPFFRFETDPHTYLLTSAHVLLDPEQMKKLINDQNVYYGICGTDAYQPPESVSVGQNTRHHLGRLELAVYKKGGENKSGMEIALVRIDENRLPIDGKFPDTSSVNSSEFGVDNPFEFPFENVCDMSTLSNSNVVYKYGSVTGLTKGKVRVQGASVRTSMLWDDTLGFEITLHEQIEIESVDGQPFGELGDSGSLVLQKDGSNLAAVGIFEGKSGDIYMMTPIVDIKQTLSETLSLYREPPTEIGMDVEENSTMAIKLYYVPTNNDSSQSNIISHDIGREVARQTAEMQTNVLHHTEHKIGSVKAELTAIKVHIDNTKNDIKQNMDQMENRVIGNISDQIGALKDLFVNGPGHRVMQNNT